MGTQVDCRCARYGSRSRIKSYSSKRSFNAILGKSANIIADAIKSDPKKFERIGSRLLVSSSIGGKATRRYHDE